MLLPENPDSPLLPKIGSSMKRSVVVVIFTYHTIAEPVLVLLATHSLRTQKRNLSVPSRPGSFFLWVAGKEEIRPPVVLHHPRQTRQIPASNSGASENALSATIAYVVRRGCIGTCIAADPPPQGMIVVVVATRVGVLRVIGGTMYAICYGV